MFVDLQTTDPNWYTSVTGQLTPEQSKQLEEIFKLADQRKAAAGKSQCFLYRLRLAKWEWMRELWFNVPPTSR